MLSFNEWLEKRMDEGSLGLKRRERVARGLAKRAAVIDQMFPNPSDSSRHLAAGQAEFDAQAAAGRFLDADARMQQRTNARMQRMTQGDKVARQMMAGKGGIDATRSNADRSAQSLSALANYNRPEILAKRGQDPNWAADGRRIGDMANDETSWYASKSAEAKRKAELDRIEYEKKYGERGHSEMGKGSLKSAARADQTLADLRSKIGQ